MYLEYIYHSVTLWKEMHEKNYKELKNKKTLKAKLIKARIDELNNVIKLCKKRMA